MSILVDPYMFELTDEKEIQNNIIFFRKLIKMSSNPDKSKRMSIAMYKGMIDRIRSKPVQLFPIKLPEIEDKELKSIILKINASFVKTLMKDIENLDIDACNGNQDFFVEDKEFADDEKYYELLCTLLIPCYSKTTMIDERILTGYKVGGKDIGYNFVLTCNCTNENYCKRCEFVDVDEFISDKDKAIEEFKKMKKEGNIKCIDTIPAIKGDHHNKIQADGKKFKNLNDLSAKNKSVLLLLGKIGLFKVIFGRFCPKGNRRVGTMSIISVDEEKTQDIVNVKFTAETEMVLQTQLYFPKGVGKLLYKYFESEQLMYKSVEELIEKIG